MCALMTDESDMIKALRDYGFEVVQVAMCKIPIDERGGYELVPISEAYEGLKRALRRRDKEPNIT